MYIVGKWKVRGVANREEWKRDQGERGNEGQTKGWRKSERRKKKKEKTTLPLCPNEAHTGPYSHIEPVHSPYGSQLMPMKMLAEEKQLSGKEGERRPQIDKEMLGRESKPMKQKKWKDSK